MPGSRGAPDADVIRWAEHLGLWPRIVGVVEMSNSDFIKGLRACGYTLNVVNGWVEVCPAPPIAIVMEVQQRNKRGALAKELTR